jgi:type II secretory pathway component PulM
MELNRLRDRIAGLSKREKIFVVITLFVVIFLSPYIFLYTPSSKKATQKQKEFQSLKKEIEALGTSLTAQPLSQPEVEPLVIPKAENLSSMLVAITREAGLAGVEFVSITPEGIEYKDRFIEMKVKMELRVLFRHLYDFLKNIEQRQRLFIIKALKFETNDTLYPSGIALIKAVVYLKRR